MNNPHAIHPHTAMNPPPPTMAHPVTAGGTSPSMMGSSHPSQGQGAPSGGFVPYNSYIYSNSGVIQQFPNIFDICAQSQQQNSTSHVATH